jgi:hypothetical protein
MKIGKFFKFVLKTLTAAIALGSIAYIIKDMMDKKASDNFDDTWDDDFDEDFDDLFDDEASEDKASEDKASEDGDVAPTREYVKMEPSKMSAETCKEE